MQPIRIGIVGLGKIALEEHVPALRANSTYALAACVSNAARLEGVPHFPSLEAMLDGSAEIDAVAICTPPQSHYEVAKSVLMRKKHVLLEKPPCPTLEEFDDLVRIAQDNSCTLFQTWHARETAAVDASALWMKARLVQRGHVVWKEDVRQWHPRQTWIWRHGGFGVLDAGINAISILTKVLPEEFAVETAHLLVPANCESPVAAEVVFRTGRGALITAEFDFRYRGMQARSVTLDTDGGHLSLVKNGAELGINGSPVSLLAQPHEYAALYNRFARLVADSKSDTDKRPLELVVDIFHRAERTIIEPFHE